MDSLKDDSSDEFYSDSFNSDSDNKANNEYKESKLINKKRNTGMRPYNGTSTYRGGRTSNLRSSSQLSGSQLTLSDQALSFSQIKFDELRNQIVDLQRQLKELKKENQLLQRLQIRQQRELAKMEEGKTGLPNMLSAQQEEIRVLKEMLRQAREKNRENESMLKSKDKHMFQMKQEVNNLRKLAQDKNLLERDELNHMKTNMETQLKDKDKLIQDLQRKLQILSKSQRRRTHPPAVQQKQAQLQQEKAETESKLQSAMKEMDSIPETPQPPFSRQSSSSLPSLAPGGRSTSQASIVTTDQSTHSPPTTALEPPYTSAEIVDRSQSSPNQDGSHAIQDSSQTENLNSPVRDKSTWLMQENDKRRKTIGSIFDTDVEPGTISTTARHTPSPLATNDLSSSWNSRARNVGSESVPLSRRSSLGQMMSESEGTVVMTPIPRSSLDDAKKKNLLAALNEIDQNAPVEVATETGIYGSQPLENSPPRREKSRSQSLIPGSPVQKSGRIEEGNGNLIFGTYRPSFGRNGNQSTRTPVTPSREKEQKPNLLAKLFGRSSESPENIEISSGQTRPLQATSQKEIPWEQSRVARTRRSSANFELKNGKNGLFHNY